MISKSSFRVAGALLVMAGAAAMADDQDSHLPAPQPAKDGTDAAAAKAAPAPKPKWETSAGLGASITDGNSETVLFTANVATLRKFAHGELHGGVDAGYGENNSVQNVGFVKGFGQYNWLFADPWYGFVRAEGLHDAIADIKYRVPLSAGIGYYFIKNDKTTLSAEVGPGYVFQKIGQVEDDFATVRFAEKFTHKLSDRARVFQSIEFQPQVDDWDNYFITGEVGAEADLTKQLALRVVFQDWYVSQPALGRKANDLRLIAGVNYKFQ